MKISDGLLDLVYDAASNLTLWPAVLRRLATVTNSSRASMFVRNRRGDAAVEICRHGTGPERPWSLPHGSGHEAASATDVRVLAIASRTDQDREPDRDGDRIRGIEIALQRVGSRRAILGLYRDSGARAFARRHLELCRTVAPHLQRAFGIYRTVSTTDLRWTGAADVLDRWPFGIFLFNAKCQVVHMNAEARLLVHQKGGLTVRASALSTAHPQAAERLRQAVARACAHATPMHEPTLFQLSQTAGNQSLAVAAARLEVAPDTLFDETPVAVLIAVDAREKPQIDGEALRALFLLTPMEVRVTQLLLTGQSLAAIAETLGVSVNTTRTHLKRIFGKIAVTSQSELVRVILSSLVELRWSGGPDHPRLRPNDSAAPSSHPVAPPDDACNTDDDT